MGTIHETERAFRTGRAPAENNTALADKGVILRHPHPLSQMRSSVSSFASDNSSTELRLAALRLTEESDPVRKAGNTIALAEAWQEGRLTLDSQAALQPSCTIPGRPEKPELISPKF